MSQVDLAFAMSGCPQGASAPGHVSDGAVKYEGAPGRDALVAEKKREDLLRELGFGVVRLVWSDLGDPTRVQAKMLAEITILRQRRLW